MKMTIEQVEISLINEMGLNPKTNYTQSELREMLSAKRYKAKGIERPGTTSELMEVAGDLIYSYQYGSRSGNLR